ncbi:cation:proton antiporter [Trichlorobacter lovleyi]|uniref:monovalent cation:proton antiporter family protein n=1 Tax=Trichlorobacter lovleyi TaxID=313985 RepID=UPI00223F3858|nr:monovalent cation:proton antiporter family protein [Trichlorobacter lovleyi]QOX78818.1 cation:proton antiporter [Trichlorobacter lovleyi]
MEFSLLKDLVLLFGLALVTVVLFRQFKLPSIIGFLCTGIVAGPYALGLIKDTHQVEQMAEIGVVLLLFTIGIEFSLKELLRIRHLVLWGGGLQVGVTIGAVALLWIALGFSWQQSVFFGFLVSLSSTAILMKLLMDSGEMDSPHGKTCLGILIFQDLCVVPLMLLTPFLGGAGDGLTGIVIVSAKALLVVVISHFSARFAVPWIFHQVVRARSRELFILTIIFVGFGTAFLTAQVGLSLALGAFIAGLAISESEYSHQVMGDIIPFRDAFMSLFFISVGMLLDPAAVLRQPLAVLLIVISIVLIKWLVASAAALVLRFPPRPALISGLLLAQVGEFAFVLSHAGQKYGLLSDAQYQLFLAASVTTMALTPFFLKFAEPFSNWVTKRLPAVLKQGVRVTGVSHDRFPMEDHVIIVGFGVNGKNLARVLNGNGIRYIAIETNHHTVKAERKKGTRIIFGDASRPEILSHAMIEKARIVVIAISDATATRRVAAMARQMRPNIHLIVRTRYVAEMEPLFQLGVNDVVPEEFETSVEIFSRVLRTYMIPHDQIDHCIAEIRRDSYQMFRTVSRRHSHATGISGYLSGVELGTFRVQPGSTLEGTQLRDGLLRERSGVSVLVIKRGDEVNSNPDPVWQFEVDDIVLVLGKADQLVFAAHLFES